MCVEICNLCLACLFLRHILPHILIFFGLLTATGQSYLVLLVCAYRFPAPPHRFSIRLHFCVHALNASFELA